VLTPKSVIVTFYCVALIFIPIGIIVMSASFDAHSQEIRYDNKCTTKPFCFTTVTFEIEKDMAQPVMLYYKVTNFYQNHRRYVKSRSNKQLRGDATADIASCTPLMSLGGDYLYPCGLVAHSYFNDVFHQNSTSTVLPYINNNRSDVLTWTDTGIAWPSDVKGKYKAMSVDDAAKFRTTTKANSPLPPVTNEDFMVWMRTSLTPTFKKLRWIIKQDLKKGQKVTFSIKNAFDVTAYDGQKALVLSTVNTFGGKNDFLGYAYTAVGALCFLLATLFSIKTTFYDRPMGDMSYYNWHASRTK